MAIESDRDAEALSPGNLLRRERERSGLSVAEVAERLRIRDRYIHAIEDGQYHELPPQPYLRGFLEAYAEMLGIDAAELAHLREGEPVRPFLARSDAESFNWRNWTIPITLIAGASGYLILRFFFVPPPPSAPIFPTLPAPVVAVSPPNAGDQGKEPVSTGPALLTDAAAKAAVRLLLRSEGSTWITASADGGKEARFELQPGQNLELYATRQLEVTIGDAGLVRITANDRELGFVGRKGETRRGLRFVEPVPRPAGDPANGDPGAQD